MRGGLAATASILSIALGACGDVSSETDAAPEDAPTTDAVDVDAAGADAAPPFCAGIGLVGCYELEPASPPGRISDGSSSGNHGTGAGITFVTGKVGMAVGFDPTMSRVTVPESTSLDVSAVTIELWVRPDAVIATGGRQALFDNNGQYGLFLVDGNTARCAIALPSAIITLTTTVAVNVATWTHVACTYDASAATASIYFDGAPVATLAGAGDVLTNGIDGTSLGGNSPCTAAPCLDAFDGTLDQIRVWSRRLERAEICASAANPSC